MGGRVSLINSVLFNLSIHHLAFYKDPKKVVKDFITIQHRYLWAGNSKNRFVSWISWKLVCKPKEFRCLGIKHVGRFNRAILAKWLWKFHSGGNEIWRKTLTNKYGTLNIKVHTYLDVGSLKTDSLWLKDILSISISEPHDNFCNFMGCSVGDGSGVAFRKSNWIGDTPLKVIFPRLFQACRCKASSLSEMGEWDGELWRWNLLESMDTTVTPPEPDRSDCRMLLEASSVKK
ncbi:unnamed protein product [Lathyrus sativus]|nr:unnamed protein product [Lathyrus sativus]